MAVEVEVAEGMHIGTVRRVGAAPAHVRLQDHEYLRHLAAAHYAQSVAPGSGSAPPGAGLVRTYIELLTKVRRCRLTPG